MEVYNEIIYRGKKAKNITLLFSIKIPTSGHIISSCDAGILNPLFLKAID